MQQSVIFGILLTLINKKKVTREALADKYEVSIRTIARYIDVLSEAHVPIYGVTGKDGGICIDESYCLERGFLTQGEMSRLIACVGAMSDTFKDDDLNQVILQKLSDAKDRETYAGSLIQTESIYIDSNNWTNPNYYRKKIALLNNAIVDCKVISFEYSDRYSTKSSRIVYPDTLVLKEGIWYLYSYCTSKDDYRLFRLSRISNLHITDETFVKREDSDVTQCLKGDFDTTQDINLVISFNNLVLHDIEEWLGSDTIISQNLSYTATATIHGGSQLIAKLLSFGSDVTVLQPTSLVAALRAEVRRILMLYGE